MIDLGPLCEDLGAGDSVAVSGACLTVTEICPPQVSFGVVPETLTKTTLGSLDAGARVNLERSLKLSDTLDGHWVQGHVDGVAEVREIRTGGGHIVTLTAEGELICQMVPKGSVCLDGVSLTVADLSASSFSVALIPATLEQTTLGSWKVASKVNVETDVIGKYVRRHLQQLRLPPGDLTMEKLRDAGFA